MLMAPVQEEGRVRHRKAFQRYEVPQEDGKEMPKVHFTDGFSDICDAIVDADGGGSKTNKQIGARNLALLNSHWSFLTKRNILTEGLQRLP